MVPILIFSLFSLSISSLILSGACRIAGVRSPAFFAGMVICFIVGLSQLVTMLVGGVLIGFVSGSVPVTMDPRQLEELLKVGAPFAFFAGPFLAAGIFSIVLEECSYGRGLIVWLCQLVVIVLAVLTLYCASLVLKGGRA